MTINIKNNPKPHPSRPISHDRFGFRFWLAWILWFAGSLILAAAFWTWVIGRMFGAIRGFELTLSWALAVFGSWFILVIPFMRKKEQIWKRLNIDEEKALSAWLKAMGIFIGMLIASSLGWGLVYRSEILNHSGVLHPAWAKAVFGTWLVLTLPFLIWMYKKADQIFKTAVNRQTAHGPVFKTAFIERSKRLLPEALRSKIEAVPALGEEGRLLNLICEDGSKIQNVFVINSLEIIGVYDRTAFSLKPSEVVEVEPVSISEASRFEESKWLRLDGRA